MLSSMVRRNVNPCRFRSIVILLLCLPHPPRFGDSYSVNLWKQKRHGRFQPFAHPCYQAFALPQFKDKQRSQPTPSDYIRNTWLHSINGYSHSGDIIHPRRRLPLHYLLCTDLSCAVRDHRMITIVNAFPRPALQTAWWSLSIDVSTHPPLQAG